MRFPSWLLGATATLAAAFVLPAIANAAGSRGASLPEITTVTTAGPCKAAMQTKNDTYVVQPGDSHTNPAAASVTMVKPCSGAVTAQFVSEVDATGTTQQIRVLGLATCVSAGGYAAPHCTVGQKIDGSPGEMTLKDFGDSSVAQTHSAAFVWTGLKRGRWRFDVKPVGPDSPELEYRTLIVNAYSGG